MSLTIRFQVKVLDPYGARYGTHAHPVGPKARTAKVHHHIVLSVAFRAENRDGLPLPTSGTRLLVAHDVALRQRKDNARRQLIANEIGPLRHVAGVGIPFLRVSWGDLIQTR